MKRSTILEFLVILFAILFLYTGISKLMDYNIAKEQIKSTPLLAPFASVIVIVLPTLEIATAVMVFIQKTRKLGLQLFLWLMLAFTGYILYILAFNKNLPCTCGGVLQEMSWPEHIIFNLGFISLAIIALVINKGKITQVETF